MNKNDITKLECLNERYGSTNLTGFKLVNKNTSKKTVLRHIETDIEILNSSKVENKHVYRVIVTKDCIDICSNDNGTPVSYFFRDDAGFAPESIALELKAICDKHRVHFKD